MPTSQSNRELCLVCEEESAQQSSSSHGVLGLHDTFVNRFMVSDYIRCCEQTHWTLRLLKPDVFQQSV